MISYIFDIGGVLIKYDPTAVIGALARNTNVAPQKIARLFQLESLYPVETGRIIPRDFFLNHVRAVMPELTFDQWVKVFVDHYEPNPAGMELLIELKAAGNPVYLLSNLAEFHKTAIERKIPDFFRICRRNFFSYELGFHKPEIAIYEAVCRDIGVKPEQCVFFDDVDTNVQGANQTGMTGILFSNDNLGAIRERLKETERRG